MADTIKVQFEQLEDSASMLKEVASAFLSLLDQLDKAINNLLAQWTGQGAYAFFREYQSWRTSMSRQAEILDACAGILMVVRNRFFSVEGDVKDHWDGM